MGVGLLMRRRGCLHELMVAKFPLVVGLLELDNLGFIQLTYFLNNIAELVKNTGQLYFPFLSEFCKCVLQLSQRVTDESVALAFNSLILHNILLDVLCEILQVGLVGQDGLAQIGKNGR